MSSQYRLVHFSGTVQGVGFRYTVNRLAGRFDVSGYVKNLPDGRVELAVEGRPDQIAGLLDDISGHMGQYIGGIDQHDGPAEGRFAGFEIRL